ncbi:AAWKG family protein [Streptomyces sp. NPDC047014]|uniref:AAWKG family protein n=1 Tax=Streptomyces sp. NPDC047014 TaxID=3155736 RepID=UPI0033EE7DCC
MADRYDPKSGENLNKFDKAGDSPGDTWATLVTHITGYPVPDRNTVFDKLKSDHGGKLFRMDIKERGLGLLVKDSGFLRNKGEDYDIWFFDSGKKQSIMQARIVFEGRVKSGEEVIFAGPGSDNVHDAQVREGNEFTDYNKAKMSTIPLARYMNGPRAALLGLLGGSSQHARFSNLGVPGPDVVDLKSFDTTGASFDFAAKFFKDHAVVLKDWEDRFGRDDASWKGEAADVFRGLVKKIRENYDNYVETFNETAGSGNQTGTGATVYSRALSLGRKYLEDSATQLLDAWLKWAKSPYYDPHQVLRYVLDELAQWVDANNVAKTDIKVHGYGRGITTVRHSPQTGYTQEHPEYGDLSDIANWAKVGDKAVKIWTQGVDEYLGKPAAQVQSALNNHFLELGKDFSGNIPKPKSTRTASEEYEKKKRKEEEKKLNQQNEENRKYQDDLRNEQNKQREEDRKYQEKLREEQNKQREEDRKYQDELREEQKREQDEAKRLQGDLRNEQNKQRDEDRKYQDELREEQKREQDEAKREAEEQRKAMEKGLGDLNDPKALGDRKLPDLGGVDGLDGMPDVKLPVTESLGPLGDVNSAVTRNLGDLGDVNGPGGDNQAPAVPSLAGPGGLNTGPGAANKAANDANEAITRNLGSLGDLNRGADGPLTTPTGGSTRLTDGKLTTDFPDGSHSTLDPKTGVVTTTHPDGSITKQDLGDGARLTNPDGSVTSLGKDGRPVTTFPDGTVQTVDPATGQVTITNPDGTSSTRNLGDLGSLNGPRGTHDLGNLGDINTDLPTESIGDLGGLNTDRLGLQTSSGGHIALGSDGLTTTFPDGSKSVLDPATGILTSTDANGSSVTTDLTHGARVNNPDGSTTVLDNGRLSTTHPDGSSEIIDPETGIATVTDAQGRTETVNLNDLNSRAGNPRTHGLDVLDELRGLNGPGTDGTTSRSLPASELHLPGAQLTAGASGGGLSGSGGLSAGGGLSGTDSVLTGTGTAAPLSGGSAGSAGSAFPPAAPGGGPGAPGAPGSPGMPMGGGMGGAGGGDKGNGERVRAVLVDAAEESERRNRRRRSPWNRQEDSDTFLAPASRVATTGGESAEEEPEPGRRTTSSADYLEEDADVWGTEEGGTPAVIGR